MSQSQDDIKLAEKLVATAEAIKQQLARVIVGQEDVVEQMLWTLFSQGHCLLVGVPGLAKTLLVRSLAEVLDMQFQRIQFTPDLMPMDILGVELTGDHSELVIKRGPIFANIILADEINRTPPKTQAAMLEAMQERQVTFAGERQPLPQPFFVLATQNPIEQEGTYPLPEAQLDRFMLSIPIGYPTHEQECQLVLRTTQEEPPTLEKVTDAEELIELIGLSRRVPVSETVVTKAVELVRRTRPNDAIAPGMVRRNVRWGAGPRASQYLILAAKTRALLSGKFAADWEDVQQVAVSVLRHRIVTTFAATAEGITSDAIVEEILLKN